ncbi:MAG TPA: M14 family zinc carboxypeptidase [Vicinamibacterales bacterium]|nr:M14 family zinc carboxypeptidase [Vicinamibacterales bacterium]
MSKPGIPVLALACALLPALVSAPHAQAPAPTEWWPGATYDPAVPTPKSTLGHDIGTYYTEHREMTDYMRQLDAASDRVKVFRVGESIEHRELLLVAVSSPEHIRDLEAIRERIAELRDPRKTSAERAREIAATTPAIAWMSFANDGNESAAFETGIQLAYHLAAGQDEATRRVLDNVVTIIYPAHNPESHSRHVAWMKASATGNPDPSAQEHRGDWRMDTNNNHYQIDLNRDAVFQTQPESRTIVEQIHRWNPVVYIDHHGNPDRFYFPPWAKPVNAQLGEDAKKWVQLYGKNIAAAFDRHGWTYFTHQVYDLHYPGYYDSYPTLNGATGMTFETDGGGNKGLAYRLPDGRVTTLLDGVLHHFTGAFASLLTTADNREARVQALYDFRASAMKAAGTAKVQQFVLVPGKDASRTADLVALLLRHQIEVHRASAPFKTAAAHRLANDGAEAKSFPAGAYLVYTNQPQVRLLRTLLDRETPLDPAFVDEVMKAKAYNDSVGENAPKKSYGFYDINAWSLPLAYGVDGWWTEDRMTNAEPVTSRPSTTVKPPARARFAYLFRWNSAGASRLLGALWKDEYHVSLAREPFTLAGRDFDANTVVVRVQPNPESLHARIAELAVANDVEIVAADTAMVDAGKDLGDRSVVDLKAPTVAVVTEEPTSTTAYGAIWYLLERVYGIPFTAIRGQDIASVDLKPYNVIVLPDGQPQAYGRMFSQQVVDRLKGWVRDGGTLVCVKGAAQWAAGERVGLTTARDKFAEQPAKDQKDGREPRRIDTVPGAFVRVNVDGEHYIGAGIDGPVTALFRSNVVYAPSKEGARAATLDPERPLIAGFAFDDAKEALKNAPFVWDEPTGGGHVTCFADDVTFRGFLLQAQRLWLNALLLGPSF